MRSGTGPRYDHSKIGSLKKVNPCCRDRAGGYPFSDRGLILDLSPSFSFLFSFFSLVLACFSFCKRPPSAESRSNMTLLSGGFFSPQQSDHSAAPRHPISSGVCVLVRTVEVVPFFATANQAQERPSSSAAPSTPSLVLVRGNTTDRYSTSIAIGPTSSAGRGRCKEFKGRTIPKRNAEDARCRSSSPMHKLLYRYLRIMYAGGWGRGGEGSLRYILTH